MSTNDVFNTYNFFEFDYPERPGFDAIRVQYYTSNVSSLDLASKIDSACNISVAGLVRFNKWKTDFQIMAGYLQKTTLDLQIDSTIKLQEKVSHDFTSGFGFSGSLKEISLRGEISYFYFFVKSISPNQLLISFASDYSFKNDLNFMFEFFYTDKIIGAPGFNMMDMNSGNKSAISQTITKFNFFGQLSYPISPIINSILSGMYFYSDDISAFYTGPGLEISLSDNITLSAFLQIFYSGIISLSQ